MFLTALSLYLLREEARAPEAELQLYKIQMPTVTQVDDPIAGKARFLTKADFPLEAITFPTAKEAKYRKRGSIGSVGSEDSAGSTSTVDAGAQLHTISPDSALIFNDHLYIVAVFECTKAKDTMRSVRPNFHQIISMMLYQPTMLGLVLDPEGFSIQLVVKDKPDGKLHCFRTPTFTFKHDTDDKFNVPNFMEMCKCLLHAVYITA